MPPVFFTLCLRSKDGDRHVSHTRIRPREWLLSRYEPDKRITFHVGERIPHTQPRKRNPAKTPGLGPEVQTEVKNTQNGSSNFTFSALRTLGQVMVGSVGFEPTTSRGPGLHGTSQAAKRRPGKPAALHDASRRLAHDPVAR